MKNPNSLLILVIFICVDASSQINTVIDSIICNDRILIVEYPKVNRTNYVLYEEGFFKTINCILDSVSITVHYGSMVNLPLTKLKDKVITSKLVSECEFNSIKGYQIIKRRRRYFREDYYFKHRVTIVFENVDESKLKFYENIMDSIRFL
ncbi:MAG: hypothetical protein Q8T08_21685 [Ignavibacteria bacterium]|jgi:hypothetical protein|nr:hypothetical protein [Ignavibacteria bacterium]